MPDEATDDFTISLVDLIEPAMTGLAGQLGAIVGLDDAERHAVHRAAAAALRETLLRKVNRVLVLELNAARLSGRLSASDSRTRWQEWLAASAQPGFWDSLTKHYPTLRSRLDAVIDNRCASALTLARRFSADRAALSAVLGAEPGELAGVVFGAGDSHRGGHTVAILRCAAGRVVYKPRSLAVDSALARLLARLLPDDASGTHIRVPYSLCRAGYGWAEHVEHRYCVDDGELRCFYRGIGTWLAVMRLLNGSDLHAENLIAVGPVPTVVDCEALFTPRPPVAPSGYGLAVDRAAALVGGSVLGTGLLPGRGLALGWRGVDSSAVGGLPGQQPTAQLPMVVDAGTDVARIALERQPVALADNHPSPNPVLSRFWDVVINGFDEMSDRLREIDRAGQLDTLLAEFADCPVRVVLRDTESYAELSRMLWHPVSLHDEPAARRRAAELLARHAANMAGVPSDPAVIDAEIADLLIGDVPFFTTTPRRGRLAGPGGAVCGAAADLTAEALRRWREADLAIDRQIIQAALVSAYLNEGWLPETQPLRASRLRTGDLDRRRRSLAANIMRGLHDASLPADDGTVTWIAPVLNSTGWAVQPLSPDGYGGLSGVAVLLSAYLCEVEQKRADEVSGLEQLLAAALCTMRAAEDQRDRERRVGIALRPEPPGGYIGLGSRIWSWLLLQRLGAVGSEAVHRACALAEQVPEAVEADESFDVLTGMAGAVVPLLRLAEHSGDVRWFTLAERIGRRLVALAVVRDGIAYWPSSQFPQGLGGFAHGSTGIGWALARLASARANPQFETLADAAFRHEEMLYDANRGGWLDLREPDRTAAAWCHGAGGIGVAAADRVRRGSRERGLEVLSRAAAACWSTGMGWNHTLCHGDLGNWEVVDNAVAAGVGPPGLDRATLDAQILGSLEEHGPVSGLARDAFAPGLLPGIGGVAYQLLRMCRESRLPSVLLPDPGS
jgi:type 2 lantibiotic biosynthesis protein LanM